MKPVQHSEYDYYWIPAKRFVLCLLWKDLALQKWIWKMIWKLDFFHWWDEGENGWFVVIYSSPWAEVNLNSPALLVSVLLVKWSVWIVLKWFIRRLVSTLLSWSLLHGKTNESSIYSWLLDQKWKTSETNYIIYFFKRPTIFGTERHPSKHSKVRYHHFGGWLETSNHPFLPRVLSNVGKSRLHRVWVLLQVNMNRADRWQKVGLQNNSTTL